MSSPGASAGGAGNSSQPAVLLKSSRGSIIQFILVTIPFLIVLLYFLYLASKRPAYYNNNNNNNSDDESLIRLFDMLCIFLSLLMCWMIFTIYIIIFVPKRRHLIGKYLKDDGSSISTIGDVIYNETSSHGGGLLCCGRRLKLSSNNYGYAVYSHPNNNDGRMIRKRVRVYQYYTREKITILLLPNRPLSGQAKVCVYAYMLAPFILCVL